MADDLVDDFTVDEKLSDNDEPKSKKRKRKVVEDTVEDKKEEDDPKEDFLEKLDDYFQRNLSTIEREAISFGEDCFFSSNRDHKMLSDYLRGILSDWNNLISDKGNCPRGSPFILVLASSAIRAVELNRNANEFKTKKCKTAKLFAKHMKLKDQVTFLEKNDVHFAVGTPNRIANLLELGCLKTNRLKVILIDWYWKDMKKRRIVNIPETKKDLFLLFQKHLVLCFGKEHKRKESMTKIALF